MRVDILSIGSLGDVQPYVALGLGLRAAGHQVRLVTLGGFEELVRSHRLDHLVVGQTPQTIANTSTGQNWLRKRTSVLGFLRGFVRVANSLIEEGMANYWSGCRDVDGLIASPLGLLLGAHIAERLRVPLIRAQLAPPVIWTGYSWDCRRRTFGAALRSGLAASLDAGFQFAIWNGLRRSTNVARREILNLPSVSLTAPLHGMNPRTVPLLGAYSTAVVPRPPDWREGIHVTGYWFLDDPPGWVPPKELIDFLTTGSQPVFIGFGSTPFPQSESATDLVIRAVARSGHRAILVAGGSGLATGQLSPNVLSVDSVPHGWLFAQVCAAVHHGGAGVTGAALRAGLPSVVVPVFADQPFWANRVFQLGAGPRPIPAKQLTEQRLTEAIHATANTLMRRRAAELGNQIRSENGVARAVEIIESHFRSETRRTEKYQHAN